MTSFNLLIEEYRLENARQAQAYAENERLILAMQQDTTIIATARQLEALKAPYIHAIGKQDMILKNINEHIADIKDNIAREWTLGTTEYKSDAGTIVMRTTKSLIIRSKQKVVEVLRNNNKIEEGINTFKLTFLRKLKDVGILPDDAAYYEPNQSVVISLYTQKAEE